jgi:hypothetical protein
MWITENKTNEKTTVKRKTASNSYEQGKSSEVEKIINRNCFTVKSAITKRWQKRCNKCHTKGTSSEAYRHRKRKMMNIIKKEPKSISSKVAGIVKSVSNAEISHNSSKDT